MDIRMNHEEISSSAHPIWDVIVDGGDVPLLYGDEEELQHSIIAVFLQKGSVPKLPDVGVSWTDFLTKKITFGDLDTEIRQSLKNVGLISYVPDYQIEGDRLTVTVSKSRGIN